MHPNAISFAAQIFWNRILRWFQRDGDSILSRAMLYLMFRSGSDETDDAAIELLMDKLCSQ